MWKEIHLDPHAAQNLLQHKNCSSGDNPLSLNSDKKACSLFHSLKVAAETSVPK